MVTTGQIRRHIAAIRAVIEKPCSCRTRKAKRKCDKGKELLQATVNSLEWVLGENMDYEEFVAFLAASTPNPFRENRIILFEKEGG